MKKSLLLLVSLLSLASPQLVHAGSTATLVAPFSAAAMEFPEDIVTDPSGNCYVLMADTVAIKKVTPAGGQSVYCTITGEQNNGYVNGLVFDPAGNLYVTGGSGVWKVTPTGTVTLFASMPANATFGAFRVAIDPKGNLYVSNGATSNIWKVTPAGTATLWSADPLLAAGQSVFIAPVGVNSMAINPSNTVLYADVTGAGSIVAIPINADGSAGTGRLVVQDPALIGADGMKMDSAGNLFVPLNYQNRVAEVTPSGIITEVVSGAPLSFPTGLALSVINGQTTMFICSHGNPQDFFGPGPFSQFLPTQGVYAVSNPGNTHLTNSSVRGNAGSGSARLILGFVVDGTTPKTMLIRAIGPTLGSFGVTGTLQDPLLQLFGSSATTPLYSNTAWGGSASIAATTTKSGAFPLAATSQDSCLLVTLPPGTYSAEVSGASGDTGIALIEVYEVR